LEPKVPDRGNKEAGISNAAGRVSETTEIRWKRSAGKELKKLWAGFGLGWGRSGYMGQLIEWTAVVTEGRDLKECRVMLRDALHEMVLAYRETGKEMPTGNALIEQLPVEVQHVGQAT
jgi:predicted RNase H-like HicB family nuclease